MRPGSSKLPVGQQHHDQSVRPPCVRQMRLISPFAPPTQPRAQPFGGMQTNKGLLLLLPIIVGAAPLRSLLERQAFFSADRFEEIPFLNLLLLLILSGPVCLRTTDIIGVCRSEARVRLRRRPPLSTLSKFCSLASCSQQDGVEVTRVGKCWVKSRVCVRARLQVKKRLWCGGPVDCVRR